VIPIVGGAVAVRGTTDPQRLRSGELVYTGALRTPIAAIVRSVPLDGSRYRVAAEHFSIAADAHVWLGQIDEGGYTCETPDGRGRSRSEAGSRLARVICADMEMLGAVDITAIAQHVCRMQVAQIASAIRQVVRQLARDRQYTAVLAGQGTFLARAAASRLGLPVRDLADQLGPDAAAAAPAAAVAILLGEVVESAR
jgi:probable H4MPT-linked C1 transfer pathway protein